MSSARYLLWLLIRRSSSASRRRCCFCRSRAADHGRCARVTLLLVVTYSAVACCSRGHPRTRRKLKRRSRAGAIHRRRCRSASTAPSPSRCCCGSPGGLFAVIASALFMRSWLGLAYFSCRADLRVRLRGLGLRHGQASLSEGRRPRTARHTTGRELSLGKKTPSVHRSRTISMAALILLISRASRPLWRSWPSPPPPTASRASSRARASWRRWTSRRWRRSVSTFPPSTRSIASIRRAAQPSRPIRASRSPTTK